MIIVEEEEEGKERLPSVKEVIKGGVIMMLVQKGKALRTK